MLPAPPGGGPRAAPQATLRGGGGEDGREAPAGNQRSESAIALTPWCRLLAIVALSIGGCARELPGDTPPGKAFYYPVSVTVAPNGLHAYVVSSNFDLHYSSGWVSVVSLESLLDGLPIETTVVSEAKVLSLAGGLSLSRSGTMAVTAHRGAAALSLLEIGDDGKTIGCGVQGDTTDLSYKERLTDCDRAHMLQTACTAPQLEDADRPAGCPWEQDGGRRVFGTSLNDLELADPFATAIFEVPAASGGTEPLLAVSHLTSGDPSVGQTNQLLLFDVESGTTAGESVVLAPRHAVRLGGGGNLGVAALAVRSDAAGTFLAAATQKAFTGESQDPSAVYVVDVTRTLSDQQDRVSSHSINAEVGGVNLAGITFAANNPDLAFVTNRIPDSVVTLDTSIETVDERDSLGTVTVARRPRFAVLSAQALQPRPAGLLYVTRAAGEDLLAVASFADNVVYLFSVHGSELRPTGRLPVPGYGPFALAHVARDGSDFLLVTTFFTHALVVFDVTGDDAARFRYVTELRSGVPPAGDPAR
ncbi:MAG: hypothetical protein HY903_15325 [Deltaproteobacteria bacterium]|nr:hypothetical protein [Deltaproteobacteria bacterium]